MKTTVYKVVSVNGTFEGGDLYQALKSSGAGLQKDGTFTPYTWESIRDGVCDFRERVESPLDREVLVPARAESIERRGKS